MIMERSVDKLARYTMYAVAVAVVCALCWYFRSTLVYLIAAVIVSLLGIPLKKQLARIKIGGKSAPDAVLAIIALMLVIVIFIGIVVYIVPVIYGIVQNIYANLQAASLTNGDFSHNMDKVNAWLVSTFPSLEPDFKLQDAAADFISEQLNLSSISSVVGSFASILGDIVIGLFSIFFISFFFIKDDALFRKIIGAIVPDRIEEKSKETIGKIENLLSRYFTGLVIEVAGVVLLNFLGMWIIAGLDFSTSLAIASITGILNIIPYVGPWIGAGVGTVLGMVMKYSTAALTGASLAFTPLLLTFLGIFLFTQLVDNFLFQPLIYSKSIKSSPLEIFIVMLLAGHMGGILGMVVAIPAYTVLRAIAATFFGDCKAIRRLIHES